MTFEHIKHRICNLENKHNPNKIIFHVSGTPYPKDVNGSRVIELEDDPEDYR